MADKPIPNGTRVKLRGSRPDFAGIGVGRIGLRALGTGSKRSYYVGFGRGQWHFFWEHELEVLSNG